MCANNENETLNNIALYAFNHIREETQEKTSSMFDAAKTSNE